MLTAPALKHTNIISSKKKKSHTWLIGNFFKYVKTNPKWLFNTDNTSLEKALSPLGNHFHIFPQLTLTTHPQLMITLYSSKRVTSTLHYQVYRFSIIGILSIFHFIFAFVEDYPSPLKPWISSLWITLSKNSYCPYFLLLLYRFTPLP